MPLVAWTDLPSFAKLEEEGQTILTPERASNQYIRELHVGLLLNMMPDSALAATERQFFPTWLEMQRISRSSICIRFLCPGYRERARRDWSMWKSTTKVFRRHQKAGFGCADHYRALM